MLSNGLYPPEIDSTIPVFQTKKITVTDEDKNTDRTYNSGTYTLKYYLSEFNSNQDYNVIQLSIKSQKGGMSIVNNTRDTIDIQTKTYKYRKTDSIILIPNNDNKSTFSFSITEDDILNNDWEIGSLYKIQMRIGKIENININYNTETLSESEKKIYEEELNYLQNNQQDWLNEHNKDFSEWSTIAVIKPIGTIMIQIPSLGYDSLQKVAANGEPLKNLLGSVLNFYGTYGFENDSGAGNYIENLYSYQVKLYEKDTELLLEDSGILYANQYYNLNKFNYTFHSELELLKPYKIEFTYTTENGYKPATPCTMFIKSEYNEGYATLRDNLIIITPDILDDPVDGTTRREILKDRMGTRSFPFDIFTVEKDNEEGRISIKLCNKVYNELYSGNLILVRSDNRSNYTYWEDVKIINVVQQDINDLDIIYDYGVESGVLYTYGIQEVIITKKSEPIKYNRTGIFSRIQYKGIQLSNSPIMREFEYSYLLGENEQQLKLKFNNEMDSMKINTGETKIDTVGSKYPFILKNGYMEYKTFPIKGLISFNMDDDFLFATPYEVYNNKANFKGENAKNEIVEQYQWYNSIKYGYGQRVLTTEKDNNIYVMDAKYMQQDTIYEKLFREKVLEFLHDGKPKLFKSPTEGNLIIRLMDINLSPHQNLNRMIYSFSANAIEIDKAITQKYLDYKFLNIGKIITDFSLKDVKVGQIKQKFKTVTIAEIQNDNAKVRISNSLEYNIIKAIKDKYVHTDMVGYDFTIDDIFNIQIEFNSNPYPIDNTSLLGYKIYVQADLGQQHSSIIDVINPSGVYYFDEEIRIPDSGTLLFIGPNKNQYTTDKDGKIINYPSEIDVTINFLYNSRKAPANEKYLDNINTIRAVSQIYQNISKGESLIRLIKQKHEYDYVVRKYDTSGNVINTTNQIARILDFDGINIEANPGSQFAICDKNEEAETIVTIGKTGNLNIAGVFDINKIKYLGPEQNTDILMDYYYVREEGEWVDVTS